MEQNIDWFFFSFLFSGFLGFLVAGVLIFANKTDSLGSRLLAGFLICFSILAINYTLMTTEFYLRHPHLWRAFGWASFSFAPLAYLYVRSVLAQSFRIRKWDFLFFIPALIHAIGHIPFYILSTEEKVSFLKTVMDNPKLITLEPESMLPDGFAVPLRISVGLAAAVGQFLLLRKWKKKYSPEFLNQEQNKGIYKWLFLFSVVNAIFWLLILTEYYFHFGGQPTLNLRLLLTISGTILFVSIYLLLQPQILYGFKGWNKVPEPKLSKDPETVKTDPEPESRKTSISFEQGQEIKRSLEDHFERNLPFRKRGYMISDLSRELDLPAYMLSAYINQEYGKNFNELINEYRVNYLVNEMRSSVDYSQYTLEALGNLAGFNSRAAFIAAVKKGTGKNPSEVFGRRS
jgi:AraC-like DNA-binding protein